MPTKHQVLCWFFLTIVLWIDYYHPHFTDRKVRHFNHTANFPYAYMTQSYMSSCLILTTVFSYQYFSHPYCTEEQTKLNRILKTDQKLHCVLVM